MSLRQPEATSRSMHMNMNRSTNSAYYFLLPGVVLILAFFVFPMVRAIILSFTNADLLTLHSAQFVGISNYVDFVTSGDFILVLKTTLVYVVFGVSLTYFLGLVTALLMNQDFKGRGVSRALLILPWAVPQVVLAIIWRWMLNPHYGIANYALHGIGVVPPNFSWFSNGTMGMVAILGATVWKQYPLSMLILLAGLQTIPQELHDAASVDGASALQRFRFVTAPGLRYVTNVLVLLLTIWAFGNFVIIWLLTQGGPSNETATFTIFTYLNAFSFNKFGYGAAIGVFILLLSMSFASVYYSVFLGKRRMG